MNPGNVAILFGPADDGSVIAGRIRAAVNSTPLAVTALGAGTAVVWLVNDNVGPAGNVPILETVSDPDFAVSGMSGGTEGTVDVGPGSFGARGVMALPNPFRAATLLRLGDRAGRAGGLRILDVGGRVMRVLAAPEGLPAEVRWDGRDAGGQTLSPGVYFYEILSAGTAPATGRLVKLE